MKNRILFSVVLLLCMNALMGQSKDFPTGSAVWTYNVTTDTNQPTTSNRRIRLTGDTIINGMTHQKISNWQGLLGFFRTEDKKVYYLPLDSTEAYLYYDFNLVVGDTFLNVQPSHHITVFDTLVVNQVDSVLTNDGYRKKWYFSSGLGWIEGVGHEANLINPFYEIPLSSTTWLFCFEKDESLIIETVADIYIEDEFVGYVNIGTLTCDGFTSPTNELSLQNKKVKLSPNPFIHQFEILSPTIPDGTNIQIFSIHGQLLQSIPHRGAITLPDLASGTYLISFEIKERRFTALLQKI